MTDAQIHNAKWQGRLEGLREAARAMCDECRAGSRPELQDTAQMGPCWFHPDRTPRSVYRNGCDAGPIHDLIAKTWGSGRPEPIAGDEDRVLVCASCLRVSCLAGEFYCEEYKQADIMLKTVGELRALALEHPDYWRRKEDSR